MVLAVASVYIFKDATSIVPGCFNSEAWDFNGGKEWINEIEDEFIKLIDRPYIKRVSILGGEPLAAENLDTVLQLVNKIRMLFPDKIIWMYSGYVFEYIMYPVIEDDFFSHKKRKDIVSAIDVLVDGRFEEDKKDLSLQFRGSSNQRIINIKESLAKGEVVLWTP